MDNNRALGDIACVLFILFLLSVVLIWDGLVRRHLRFTFFATRTDAHIRGWRAVVIGVLGSCLAIGAIIGGVRLIDQINANCQQASACVATTLLLAPLASIPIAFLVIGSLILFLGWIWGALDMDGPYQRKILAPGVARSEKELVRRVTRHLHEQGLAPLPSDIIVRMATYTRHDMGMFGLRSMGQAERSAQAIRDQLVASALRQHENELRHISNEARLVLFTTIIDYYQELSGRVAQVYPWRRQKQHARE